MSHRTPPLPRSASRVLRSGLVFLALVTVTGCAGSASTAAPTPAPGTTATSAPAPSPTRASTPSPTPTPRPTPSASATSDQNGNGDSHQINRPATAGGGVCGNLDDAEVSKASAATVHGAALGGTPGCRFVTADRRTVEITVVDKKYAGPATMTQAQNDANSAVEGTPESLDANAIGAPRTTGFVLTGSMFGEPEVQGAGAVQVGNRIVSVTYTQHRKADRATVRATIIALLHLVASQIG